MTDQQIVEACLKLKPDMRQAYLEEICGTDFALMQRIKLLLKSLRKSETFLPSTIDKTRQSAITDFHITASAEPVTLGTIIAKRYKIVQELGEGGMGTVYVAEQREPVKRLVALKLIKTGMNSKVVLTRFEAERQALAMMDHPHIAKMLDGGITEQNQPFFVMELVKGVPINKFCDQEHLSPKERLELFIPVCQAVQHAHQKGIIHRDLKPSNILVGMNDGKPTAKVIDFGVAKAIHQKLTEHTMYTDVGSIIGTLEYMAPEQADLNNVDIDTRADIYALGVILYELLTGSTPFTSQQLRSAAFDEMLRMIREEEPPKPSTKISTSKALPSIAAKRKLEPQKLKAMVTGEIDWIVMKCLEKDRGRRYETANGLAADIGRYLSDEPVMAGPPSARYRFGKFVQRNRLQVIAAGLVILALLGGIVGTTIGLLHAQQATIKENEARTQAENRLKQVRRGNELLSSIFKDLNINRIKDGTEPLESVLAKRLIQSANQLEGEEVSDAVDVAKLQYNLGLSLDALGFPNESVPLLMKARKTFTEQLGNDAVLTLNAMGAIASCYLESGQYQSAIKLFEETIALKKVKLGADHVDTFGSIVNLAICYAYSGNRKKEREILEGVLPLMKAAIPNHEFTLNAIGNLALSYSTMGRAEESLKLLQENLDARKAKQGNQHPSTLHNMSQMASMLAHLNRQQEATKLFEETLELQRAKLGSDHIDTIRTANNLATQYVRVGRHSEAISLYEDSITRFASRLGSSHIDVLKTKITLANTLMAIGKQQSALLVYKEAMLGLRKLPDHPSTFDCMNQLAQCYIQLKRPEDSLKLFEEMLAVFQSELGKDHEHTLSTMVRLGNYYAEVGKHQEALQYYLDAMPRYYKQPSNAKTLDCMSQLSRCYVALKRPEDSKKLHEESLVLFQSELGPDHLHTFKTMNSLAMFYAESGQRKEAVEMVKKIETSLAKKPGPFDFNIHNGLRHLYGVFGDHRNAIRHCDIVLRNICMDGYMIICLQGVEKDDNKLQAIFQKILQDYQEFKFVKATAKLRLAELANDAETKKKWLQEVISDRDPELAAYQAVAQDKLKQLAATSSDKR